MRAIFVAALLMVAPAALEAQITTLVPPAREPTPVTAARDAAEAEARADSIRTVQLSDMREWVDSASVAMAAAPDTAAVEVDSGEVAMERPELPRDREPTTEFREGAPAPATATRLPLLALIGIGALGIGAVLVRRPHV